MSGRVGRLLGRIGVGLPLVLALVPPALIARATYRFAVNVPYWDQWPFAAFVVEAKRGVLRPAELWMPDDVHRVVVPRLVMLALAWPTGWDVRWEIATNVGLAFGTLVLLGLLIARTVRPAAPALVPWLVLATSATVFSMAQWENWTWGWQMTYFLNAFAACGAAFALARWGTRRLGPVLVFLAALAAVLSQGAGLPLLALVPLAVLATPAPDGRVRVRAAALLGLLGAAVAVLYVARLEPAPNMPKAVSPTRDLEAFGTWVVTYLGAPLAPTNPYLAARWGMGGLAAFVAAALWSFLRRPAERAHLVPWLLLGSYAVAAGALIAVGRIGAGAATAIVSRYTTIASLFWVSVPVVVALAVARSGRAVRLPALGLATVVAVLACRGQVGTWRYGSQMTEVRAARLREGGDCLRYLDWASDACLQNLCWSADLLRFFAGPLRDERLGPFATIAPEAPLSAYTLVDDPAAGRIDDVENLAGRRRDLVVTGWSRFPAVLVVVDGVVAARVASGVDRPGLEPGVAASGWRVPLRVAGHRLVEAYGVVDERHLAKLGGAVVL
jgi:hypothetical protein